jgi:class 3 adenylate cyclase
MAYKEFYYRWEWKLKASPEALWPFLTDTNRFNRDTAYPNLNRLPDNPNEKMGYGRRRLRFRRLGMPVEWVEDPFEWAYPQRYSVIRHYYKGPLSLMRVIVELVALPEGGTQVIYQVWATPRSLLGLVAIPGQIGLISKNLFKKTMYNYDRLAEKGGNFLDLPTKVKFAPGGRERLNSMRERLEAQGVAPELVTHLYNTMERVDDLGVARLRPYVLAEHWGVPRRAVLELCLFATRIGLLDLRWDLLCPMCRGAGNTATSLNEVKSEVHCPSCNIDFRVNFERSVELTFRPNPSIRLLRLNEYCIGGPQFTPHIKAQQTIPAGESGEIILPLADGRYRVRAPGLSGGQYFQVGGNATAYGLLGVKGNEWYSTEPLVGNKARLRLENQSGRDQLFILEHMAWSDKAVTASEVTTIQLFRDLFSREALRPGEQISVGRLAIVFTDLRGSTKLYRQIGDAPAFGRVMSHFDVLRQAIAEENGALVKTIGDAVMAVFSSPTDALRAMLKAQKILMDETGGEVPLMLKAGINYGSCIAVTLNDRLDYFGTTVNLAARLEGLSTGGDIIISEAVRQDPEVAEMLETKEGNIHSEPFEAMLKGFDEENFRLWRISVVVLEKPAPLLATGN